MCCGTSPLCIFLQIDHRVPEPGHFKRELFGWYRLLHSPSSGVRVFRGALQGEQVVPALSSGFEFWAVRGTVVLAQGWVCCYRPSLPLVHIRMAVSPAVGPQTWVSAPGSCSEVCGGPLHVLLEPWCCARETAYESRMLTYYGSSGSRVRWHSDDRGWFSGGSGGVQANCFNEQLGLRRISIQVWKPGPSPDSDASSSWYSGLPW